MNEKDGSWKEGPLSPAWLLEKEKDMKKLTSLADGRVAGKTKENNWQPLRGADYANIIFLTN